MISQSGDFSGRFRGQGGTVHRMENQQDEFHATLEEPLVNAWNSGQSISSMNSEPLYPKLQALKSIYKMEWKQETHLHIKESMYWRKQQQKTTTQEYLL